MASAQTQLSGTLVSGPVLHPNVSPATPAIVFPDSLVRPFMPELDTLRGIAVLGVVFLHGFEWQYGGMGFTGVARMFLLATQPGWLGVNLFFVLSGFLITGILLESRDRPKYYGRFYARRALRILPAYYLLLGMLAILHQASSAFLGLSFIYLSNLTSFFGATMDYGPLWSLAVEEHYYILWPALVRKLNARLLTVLLISICVAVPIGRALQFRYHHGNGIDWFTWFVADGLAAGSLLALLLRGPARRGEIWKWCIGLLTMGTLLAALGAPFGILTRQRLLGASLQFTVLHILFAGVLLLFLLIGSGPRRRYVNSPVLQFFGYISYGLYLFHMMMFRIYDKLAHAYWPTLQPSAGHFGLVMLRFAIAGGIAVGFTYLSRRYYEAAFLRLKDRWQVAPSSS